MRTDSSDTDNHLHWHDGGTCHGAPTLEACLERALANRWIGKVLEVEDVRRDGTPVRCYSLVISAFDHYGKRGKYVAETKLVAELLNQTLNGAEQP